MLPDCAAICAMLTTATGRKPDVVLGKPIRACSRA
jgi:ribonucleotide monophosphatase NagD (HAD superfamily)